MALIKCKECGQMMSDRASVCPNCGEPNAVIQKEHSTNRQGKMFFATLAVIVVLTGIAAFSYKFLAKDEGTTLATVTNNQNSTHYEGMQNVENEQDDIAKQLEKMQRQKELEEMQRQKEMEEQWVAEQKREEQLKWQRYLKGQWIRSGIDPTMIEIVYWVFTFRDDGYNFTYGSEYTYSSSSKFYPYYVEGNTIYTTDNKPLLRIDEKNRKLISCESPDEVYSKR